MVNKGYFKNQIECLHNIFDEYIENMPYIENGNFIVIRLDEDRRIKMRLYNPREISTFNCIKLYLTSKTNGMIDSMAIMFNSIFEDPYDRDRSTPIEKFIWSERGYHWHGIPTEEDYAALRQALDNYIKTWE